MNDTSRTTSGRALSDAFAALIDVPLRMATALADAATQSATQAGASALGAVSGSCGCDIPPPCWEPRRAGVCRMTLTPGGAGSVRVQVANCDWSRHVVYATATGQLAGWITLTPTTVVIGPQETATMLATVNVPDNVKPGVHAAGLLFVRGCVDHVVRVEVDVAECAACAVCTVRIDDCADHIHHWYEHFYCPRPCRNRVSGDRPGRLASNGIVTNG